MRARIPAAIVLCGGLGTRLRGVVDDRPKSLAPVAGRPFLAHVLDRLASEGVGMVVLSAGHMAEHIVEFVDAGVPSDLTVRVVVEPSPLGTGGAIRYAADAADVQGGFVALNGDTFFDGSIRTLVEARESSGALAAVAVVDVQDAGRYGAVRFDPDTRNVTAFEEKGRSGTGWINAGVYSLAAEALLGIDAGAPASLERDVLPRLVGRGLIAVPYPGATFLDIGTPADYALAASILSTGTVP